MIQHLIHKCHNFTSNQNSPIFKTQNNPFNGSGIVPRSALFLKKCLGVLSVWLKKITSLSITKHGFGGLVVSMLASGTQDRGFAPDRSRRIFSGVKILSMGSKAVGRVSQICGTLKNPCDYVEVESKAEFCASFANREAPHSSGSGPCRGLHARAAWAPLELTEVTKKKEAAHKGPV
jgi:hypothetical protein